MASSSATAPTPIALESTDLVRCIQHLLDQRAPQSTLVVCSTKEAFLNQLHAATSKDGMDEPNEEGLARKELEESAAAHMESSGKQMNPWTIPTLRLLASSCTVRLAFCPEVPHLRAYLAAYPSHHLKESEDDSFPNSAPAAVPLLAISNLIQLHKPTSAFSAQGINRTLSIAVEAAYRSDSLLILAECLTRSIDEGLNDPLLVSNGDQGTGPAIAPWDEEVSILNVTTKTFGAGERGWVGRTVKIRTIAERWCKFQSLPASEV